MPLSLPPKKNLFTGAVEMSEQQKLRGSEQGSMGDLGSRASRWQCCSGIVCTEIKIYTSNSFLYIAFYNFMYTFKDFNKIRQPFPDM